MQKDDFLPLVRQMLQAIGGLLVGRGVVAASEVEALVGLGVMIFTAVWMLRSRRAAEAAATAPAEKLRAVLTEAGIVPPK